MEQEAVNPAAALAGNGLGAGLRGSASGWGDSPGALVVKHLLRSPGALVGMAFIVLLVASATFALQIAPKDPLEMDLINRLKPPGPDAWMGTDPFGRDIFSRLLYGGRVSLLVGVVAVALGGITGTLLGAISGFYGGWIDHVIMRVLDALHSFPAVLLAMAIIGALGPGLTNLMLAVSVTSIPGFGRITRSAVLVVREQDYVQAARAVGVPPLLILWKHVFPNSLGPVIVTATLQIASAILAAASLSFLGMGIQPPTPEWGSMLADGRGYIERAPWLTIFPGLAIVIAVIGFNLIGDSLRDSMDPTLRGSIGQK